jgi:hypothetical protein
MFREFSKHRNERWVIKKKADRHRANAVFVIVGGKTT